LVLSTQFENLLTADHEVHELCIKWGGQKIDSSTASFVATMNKPASLLASFQLTKKPLSNSKGAFFNRLLSWLH